MRLPSRESDHTSPRGVYQDHLSELKEAMTRGVRQERAGATVKILCAGRVLESGLVG